MTLQSYTTSFSVGQTPKQAFDTIRNVRGWWSGEIEGDTSERGDEFTYRYKDIHFSKQRLIEVVPDRKVVWLVLDSYLSFPEDKTEWNGIRGRVRHLAKQRQDRSPLHAIQLSVLRQVLERLKLLHQRQPQKADHDRQGRAQPGRRLKQFRSSPDDWDFFMICKIPLKRR